MNKFLPSLILKTKEDRKENIIQWFGLILFIIIVYLFIHFRNQNFLGQIKDKRLYTVGIISGFSRTKSTKFVKYIYSYNGHSYERESSISINKYKIGDRVLVVYNPDYKNGTILPYFIDDSIKEPMNGWEKPPMNITDEEVMKYLEDKY
ncbi:hypothetical protein OBK05_06750 [Empedobacter falsenii]